jgi:hypothetical protein
MSARQYRQAPTLALAITLTLALLAAPLHVESQQAGKVYRIGWLNTSPIPVAASSNPIWNAPFSSL